MRLTRVLLSTFLVAGAFATTAPPASAAGGIVCKYYKVYDPVSGNVYTFDLTWCGV